MGKYLLEPWGRLLRQPAFLICVVIVGVCAAGLKVGADRMKWKFRKESVDLRKPLDQLDVSLLGSYELINKQEIPDEIEEELGTKEYIQWTLRDTSVKKGQPGATVNLFITYYTGSPDQVPHTPDWCYVGGGGQIESKRNTTIRVPALDGQADHDSDGDVLPLRILDVAMPSHTGVRSVQVAYFFSVNGDYKCTRNEVRVRQSRLTDRYAYFAKVEVSISGADELGDERMLAATQKLLEKLAPLLAAEYWPDWQALQGRGG